MRLPLQLGRFIQFQTVAASTEFVRLKSDFSSIRNENLYKQGFTNCTGTGKVERQKEGTSQSNEKSRNRRNPLQAE
jgi:hypothetical protein